MIKIKIVIIEAYKNYRKEIRTCAFQGRVFNQYFKLSSCPVHGNFMRMLTTISYYHHFFELKKNNNNKVTIISFIYRKNTYDLICLAQETYKRNDL